MRGIINKKATALCTVFSLTLMSSVVSAKETNYYGSFTMPNINYEDIVKNNFDKNEFYKAINSAHDVINGSDGNISEILDSFENIFIKASTAYTISYIESSRKNTEENNARATEYYNDITDMYEKYEELIKEAYDSRYTHDDTEQWLGGAEAAKLFFEQYPDTKIYELMNNEAELLEEYSNNRFEDYIYTAQNGEQYDFEALVNEIEKLESELGQYNSDSDEGMKQFSHFWEIISAYYKYYEESGTRLAQLYKQLVDVRTEIARLNGYNDFAQYSYALNNKDYSTEATSQLYSDVKENIVPLYKILIKNGAMEDISLNLKDNEIIEIVGEGIDDISSEMKAAYDYMFNNNMIDLAYSPEKIGSGNAYTIWIPEYNTPYTFISPEKNNDIWKVSSLIHEFGHFNTQLYDPNNRDGFNDTLHINSVDLSEVNSQGLELLFTEYYDKIYNINASKAYMYTICSMLDSICSGCLYDEWQTRVYQNPEMTIEEMDMLFGELCEEYGIEMGGLPYVWTQVPHNFENPMYYISYAVSAIAALEIWDISIDSRDEAIDKYMRLSAFGDYVPFRASIISVGLNDVFDSETTEGIADTVDDYFTCGYEDVDIESWYAGAIYLTSEYMQPVDNTHFEPESSATRLYTVDCLGRYYELCGGSTDGFAGSFIDTDNDQYAAWAQETGIIKGYGDNIFGSQDALTREQAAVMLFKYAGNIGNISYGKDESIMQFGDSAEISEWAYDAMSWAVTNGIIKGTDEGLLMPKSELTRSQLAQLMTNFMKNCEAFLD